MEEQTITNIVIKGEQAVEKIGWKVLATSRNDQGRETIRKILKEFELSEILYHPNLLIEKDDTKFFVIFSEKKRFPISIRKGEQRIVSGIDWFKFQLAEFIEAITGIQIGLIMYSEETSSLVLRQMNQLTKPEYWFRDEGCLLSAIYSQIRKPTEKKEQRLDKIFHDPVLTTKENIEIETIKSRTSELPILECMKCYKNFPSLCYRCIKGKHKKVKALAIWNVEQFQQKELTVQPQLFLPNKAIK